MSIGRAVVTILLVLASVMAAVGGLGVARLYESTDFLLLAVVAFLLIAALVGAFAAVGVWLLKRWAFRAYDGFVLLWCVGSVLWDRHFPVMSLSESERIGILATVVGFWFIVGVYLRRELRAKNA